MIKQTYKLFSLLGIIILLSACNKHDLSDLETYIANIRAINHSSIKPISAYEPIQHYFYNATKNRDPFIPLKSLMAKSKPKSKPKSKQPKPKVIKPEIIKPVVKKKRKKCRRNSHIDYTGIKHLKMVGTLQMGKHKWGLVKSNGIVLRVKRYDYIGKAKVLRIRKNHIIFLRIVPDGKGCWKKVYEKIFINSNY
ncbi:pilus assembly protein PilP [Candidatus Marithrix sp. Canyon 246]|uniref:pilus assembly protein PilP n=1 Tax=Candidatus Marithrix sp. Canyon 246 TaxID=1827136 RepID=UPI00084A0898|nr:pilus assembly protein PilP [Candidatus Marithrix sp. Canyon 246]